MRLGDSKLVYDPKKGRFYEKVSQGLQECTHAS
jgi:hypothetical protein